MAGAPKSRTDPMPPQDGLGHSPQYGVHVIEDVARFQVMGETIEFARAGSDKFSYMRRGPGGVVEKLISVRTPNLEIEIVTTHPIFTPSYKTDYLFLRLSKQVFVSRESTTDLFLTVPIEIGLFFTGSEIREYFDIFSCEQANSRYALYGQPELGRLCKFARVEPCTSWAEPVPYVYGRLKVVIKNEMGVGTSIGRIVFPIRDHDVYYSGNLSAFDDLKIVIRERMGIKTADVIQQNGTGPSGWKRSPRTMERTDFKFSMEMGYD